ncbi:MAG: extensin family protein [Mesorhizobium sp.]|nr:MAG: extensin family protein [Mesorhizobium sp.]
MSKVLRTIGALGTAVMAAAAISLVTEAGAKAPKLPATAPAPQLRPDGPPTRRPEAAPSSGVVGPPSPIPPVAPAPPPRPAVPAEKMSECIGELQALGVDFSRQAPITDPTGCSVQNPVVLKTFGKGMKVTPDALLDCPMALAAVRFVTEIAGPEAGRDLGSEIVSINNSSGYVCRPRQGETKLSEHAYGNALDIAGFGLADGRHIDVRVDAPGADAKFLDAVRKAACGPFKTVLGPGSDAEHALHFHFDLEPRRNGSTFCQ